MDLRSKSARHVQAHRPITRRLIAIPLTLALAFSMQLASAESAGAWSSRSTPLPSICYMGKCVPGGFFQYTVDGQGRTVTSAFAQFSGITSVCVWWIDFDYYDSRGKLVHHEQGPERPKCTNTSSRTVKYSPGRTFPTGSTCATLYSHAKKLARTCTSITP